MHARRKQETEEHMIDYITGLAGLADAAARVAEAVVSLIALANVAKRTSKLPNARPL